MKLSKDTSKILILTHYAIRKKDAQDTDQRVLGYLRKHTKKIVHITHPLHDFDFNQSYIGVYENGREILYTSLKLPKVPLPLNYLLHTILNYYWLFKYGLTYDLCIAMEDLSFVTALPLRKFGLIKKIVYYTIDFVPKRFENNLLDKAYHFIDQTACENADSMWLMTKEMLKGRKKIGIRYKEGATRVIVPIGYEIKNIRRLPMSKINFYHVVYMGGLRKTTGVDIIIKAMPSIIKKIPKIKLTIVGHGNEKQNLINLVNNLKLNNHIHFGGYVASFKKLTNMLSEKSVGFALYTYDKTSYSYYSDPSKIKLYMACGIPVVTTNVTTMASLIKKTKSGLVVNLTEKDVSRAIVRILSSKNKYKLFKANASKLAWKFDMKAIMERAIART